MRKLAWVACGVILSGCVDTFQRSDVQTAVTKLDKSVPVIVATPTDGAYQNQNYPGSGRSTAMAIRQSFARHIPFVTINESCAQLACLAAPNSSHAYLVVPEILHWEDRATEWSSIPDRVEVKLSIFDSTSAALIGSTIITGTGKVWAWVPGHPQDMLPEPVDAYIKTLY